MRNKTFGTVRWRSVLQDRWSSSVHRTFSVAICQFLTPRGIKVLQSSRIQTWPDLGRKFVTSPTVAPAKCDGSVAQEALRWYVSASSGGYAELNRYLRQGRTPRRAEFDSIAEAIDDLLDRSPRLTEPHTLYRGFSDWSFANEIFAGDQVVDRAFLSASWSLQTASFYARRHAIMEEDLQDSVLLAISVPQGFPVLRVAEWVGSDALAYDDEVILPRAMVLRIDSEAARFHGVRLLAATCLHRLDDSSGSKDFPQRA